MSIESRQPDPAILAELGSRLQRTRLAQNLSQAALAKQAGVGRTTVQRIEEGRSGSTTNLIRILRVLDLLDDLDRLVPEPRPSPVEQLRHRGEQRQRAGPRRHEASAEAGGAGTPWRWGDEEEGGRE